MANMKIIGLGNPFMGDDAVGMLVARELHTYASAHISVLEGGLAGLNLLDEMEDIDTLILIDAVHSHSKVGRILRFTIPQDLEEMGKLAWSTSASSTHAFGLAEALTLAETLQVLPQHVTLYGVELGHIQQGQALSPEVFLAIKALVKRLTFEEPSFSHA